MGSQKGLAGPPGAPGLLSPAPYAPQNLDMGTVPAQLGDTRSCLCGLGLSPGLLALTLSSLKLCVWEQYSLTHF